jgi:hypothetical protein
MNGIDRSRTPTASKTALLTADSAIAAVASPAPQGGWSCRSMMRRAERRRRGSPQLLSIRPLRQYKPCKQEILDIDDTFYAPHCGQQLAFWNALRRARLRVDAHLSCGERHAGRDDTGPGAHAVGRATEAPMKALCLE